MRKVSALAIDIWEIVGNGPGSQIGDWAMDLAPREIGQWTWLPREDWVLDLGFPGKLDNGSGFPVLRDRDLIYMPTLYIWLEL